MLSLPTARLTLTSDSISEVPDAPLYDAVQAHLTHGTGGLVVLGSFGLGKTHLCATLAADDRERPPRSMVPLAAVGRAGDIRAGLERAIGKTRLAEAREGRRVLLLDGFDEVSHPIGGSHQAFFHDLIAQVGPTWVLTSRPGHFRTDFHPDPDQVDSLTEDGITTLRIQPLDPQTVHEVLSGLQGGKQLLRSVEGLAELATSPLLLHIVQAALPHIEPGRPIAAWGLFDAWLRYALHTGPDHPRVLAALEAMVWEAFQANGYATETMSFEAESLARARIPASLRRTLVVTELDGRVRFGHRSVFEYLLAAHLAPRIGANQGHGPDELSGLRITYATRGFLVERVPRMRVAVDGDRVRIPRGNFVAGGDLSSDERPLRITHLDRPVWISRVPVTNRDWAAYLEARPDDRQDATYLRHWGAERTVPGGQHDAPVYHLWPEDADAYAAWRGARLPTADEWEKAVRGIDGRRWPWGDFWRPGLAVTSELGLSRPMPVRALGATGPAHVFSAAGSVFEYTASHWRGRADRGRVVMCGCFTHPRETSRASLRLSHKLSGNLKTGLRLAWDDR